VLGRVVNASLAAATTARALSSSGQVPTVTSSTVTPKRSSTSAAAARNAATRSSAPAPAAGPYSQARSSRSACRASRSISPGSPARFWISVRVCSTESCRWVAISARSSARTRAARSRVTVRVSRNNHGTSTIPISASTPATMNPNMTTWIAASFEDSSRPTAVKTAANSTPTVASSPTTRPTRRMMRPAAASPSSRLAARYAHGPISSPPTATMRTTALTRGGGEVFSTSHKNATKPPMPAQPSSMTQAGRSRRPARPGGGGSSSGSPVTEDDWRFMHRS
jgi:hypothetical protein